MILLAFFNIFLTVHVRGGKRGGRGEVKGRGGDMERLSERKKEVEGEERRRRG